MSDKSGFRGIIADVAKWQQFSKFLSSRGWEAGPQSTPRQRRMLSLIPFTPGARRLQPTRDEARLEIKINLQ